MVPAAAMAPQGSSIVNDGGLASTNPAARASPLPPAGPSGQVGFTTGPPVTSSSAPSTGPLPVTATPSPSSLMPTSTSVGAASSHALDAAVQVIIILDLQLLKILKLENQKGWWPIEGI